MKSIPVLDGAALDAAGVPALDAINAIEAGLMALGRNAAQQPQPPSLEPGGGAFFQPLLAALPEWNRACVNWLNFHPQNTAAGRPHSGGVLILSDFTSGEPLCLMDGIWISHRRTGYVAGLGAKYLAGAFDDIAVIGPGAIAAFAVDALSALEMLKGRLRICGRRVESTERFCAAANARHGARAVPYSNVRKALDGARLVITSTSHEGRPFVERNWLADGTLVILIDRLRLTTPDLLARAERIVTNNRESLARWGVETRAGGIESFPEIVAAAKRAPVQPNEIVLYDAGGLGVADLALAALLWSRLGAGKSTS